MASPFQEGDCLPSVLPLLTGPSLLLAQGPAPLPPQTSVCSDCSPLRAAVSMHLGPHAPPLTFASPATCHLTLGSLSQMDHQSRSIQFIAIPPSSLRSTPGRILPPPSHRTCSYQGHQRHPSVVLRWSSFAYILYPVPSAATTDLSCHCEAQSSWAPGHQIPPRTANAPLRPLISLLLRPPLSAGAMSGSWVCSFSVLLWLHLFPH